MTSFLLNALCANSVERPKAVPLTVWRAVRLWQALAHSPLTLEQAGTYLANKPLDDETAALSADTVQRTLNTLKAVGCHISRPTASNGWTYALQHHPLHRVWTLAEIQALLTLRQTLSQHAPFTEVLHWDDAVLQLLGDGRLEADTQLTQSNRLASTTYFAQGRIVDYRPWRGLMTQLLAACEQPTLLRLRYQSAARSEAQSYAYLPLALRFENGAPFVVGLSPKYPDMLSLRVDRLQAVEPWPLANDPQATALRTTLLNRKDHPPVFELVVQGASLSTWQPWGLNEALEPVEPSPQFKGPRLRVTVATHEVFPLRQKVMALGLPVQVLQPASFKESLKAQFEAMAALYAN